MSNTFSVLPNDVIQAVKFSLNFSEVVESIVRRQAIEQATQKLKIEVQTHELQAAADQFRLKNGLARADATFAWLEHHSLSIEEFELFIYGEVLATKLSHHLFQSQVEAYFLEHKANYCKAEISEIVLPQSDLAFDLFETIQAGRAGFDEAFCRYLSDPLIDVIRVCRGQVCRSSLNPAIEKAVFTAAPPQTLPPIVLDQQTHLIFVHQLIEPQLDSALSKQIRSKLLAQWLKQQIKQAEVSIKL